MSSVSTRALTSTERDQLMLVALRSAPIPWLPTSKRPTHVLVCGFGRHCTWKVHYPAAGKREMSPVVASSWTDWVWAISGC